MSGLAIIILAVIAPQILPRHSNEYEREIIESVQKGSAEERADALSVLIGHQLLDPAERLRIATELAADQMIQASPFALGKTLAWTAAAYMDVEDNRQAHDVGSRAVGIARELDNLDLLMTASWLVAESEYRLGEIGDGLHRLLNMRAQLEDRGRKAEQIRCLNIIANWARRTSSGVLGLGPLRDARELALETNEIRDAVAFSTNIAGVLRSLGQYEESGSELERALALAEQLGDPSLQFGMAVRLALNDVHLGKPDSAMTKLEALVGDCDGIDLMCVAEGHLALAQAYLATESFEATLENCDVTIGLIAPDQSVHTRALLFRARSLVGLGRIDEALPHFDEVLAAYEDKDRVKHVETLEEKGQALVQVGRLEESLEVLIEADKAAKEMTRESQRTQAIFLTVWQEREEQSRQERIELERARAADQAATQRERFLRYFATFSCLGGMGIVLLMVRSRFRRRLADTRQRAVLELNERLEDELQSQRRSLHSEMESRQELELELERNRRAESIAALTSGVAHDFNNLMTVVISSNELIRAHAGKWLDEADQRLLDESTQAAQAGAEITAQLMALTRRRSLAPQTIRLRPFLHEISGLLQRTVGEGISIEFDLASPELGVFADKTQLVTALINLCSNARDAMNGRGDIVIDVSSGVSESQENNVARISVRDHGSGMTEEQVAQACDPLYTTKQEGKGTGLGLSVVQSFVQESRGELAIDSQVGKGTTVTMSLPSRGQELEEREAEVEPVRLDGLSVMVVEDKEAVLESVSRTLKLLGCEVISQASADEARQAIIARGAPDLLLCDVRMPGPINGLELAEWMRMHHQTTPIVLMTGYSDRPLRDYPLLPKPFTARELSTTISSAMTMAG